MTARKKISLREIARICNLSPATVSRIVSGNGSFSESTRQLVFDTMRREGYPLPDAVDDREPDKQIAILVSDLGNECFTKIIHEMAQLFAEKQYSTAIYLVGGDNQRDITLLHQLEQNRTAGIVVIGAVGWTNFGEADSSIPCVLLSSADAISKNTPRYQVRSDDFVGGQLAAQELLRKGCTRPVILNNRRIAPEDLPRVQGFLHNFEQSGFPVPPESIYLADESKSSFDSARDLITYLWTKGTSFDSVYACSDWRAYGALTALQGMGINVPQEVKIIGFDGIRVSRYSSPPITTIRQNGPALALAASNLLLSVICGEIVQDTSLVIPVDIQIGQTT